MCPARSGLHRHVLLQAKPGCACITDYAVTTPLSFEPGPGGRLSCAELQLRVSLEVADEALLPPGQLSVTADLLLPDGTVLLEDVAATLQQVRCAARGCALCLH